jgi:heme-degrading monooxygenase HmoA
LHRLLVWIKRARNEKEAYFLNRPESKHYRDLCDDIIRNVPDGQGFYLWGYYQKRLWRNVYIGKAGKGNKANLRTRILEELKDERAALWCEFQSEEALKRWEHERYRKQIERALRKRGSTHVVWVSTPALSNADVMRVESDLIEALNPKANTQRPAPPTRVLLRDTVRVFKALRSSIHRDRPE